MSVTLFLCGEGVGPSGRLLSEVLAYDDDILEREHNYIQWLFPLTEESQQVHDTPVLTVEEVVAIRSDQLALEHQLRAVERMLQFYKENDHWLTLMDHNHLRITRMLKSLRLLHSLSMAERVYNILMERVHQAGDPIRPQNIAYWTDTVGLSYRK